MVNEQWATGNMQFAMVNTQLFVFHNLKFNYCPGKEALVSIVSAAADPLYRIPMVIFYCVTGKAHRL